MESTQKEYVARVVYPPHNADHKGSALHFLPDSGVDKGAVFCAVSTDNIVLAGSIVLY